MYSFLYIVQFTQQCTVCSTMYSLLYKIELPLYFENFNVPFLTNCILPFFYKIVTFSLIKTVYVLYFNVKLYCSFILKNCIVPFFIVILPTLFNKIELFLCFCKIVFYLFYKITSFLFFTKLYCSFIQQKFIVPFL